MEEPSLSIIIPSISNPLLARTIDSITSQRLIGNDQVVIVGDGHQQGAKNLVLNYGKPFEYIEGPNTNQWGNAQRNHAIDFATGDYLVFQDEDDIFCQGAFDAIRKYAILYPKKPLLFRFTTAGRLVLWQHIGDIGLSRTGGHQCVFPNIPDRLGRWIPEDDYCADWRYCASTLAKYPNGQKDLIWCDYVISVCRP